MQLPDSFISTIKNVFKNDDGNFLAGLPSLIDEVSQRWGLTDIKPVPNLSYNFVAYAKRPSPFGDDATAPQNTRGSALDDVILKMGIPNPELTSEITALKLFNGDGACQLFEYDEERGFLLLERLKPGTMLSELEDDDERTHIAADVMSSLWREVPNNNKFIQLSDWFDGLKKIRPHFNGGTGLFPEKLLQRVESLLPELFGDKNIKLMHGDFHHYNILKSDRGWLVIDPKGVIGPVGYEVGPLMINPWNSILDGSKPAPSLIEGFQAMTKRRVSILSERLGWEREKILDWATAHAILSTWWSIQDREDWDYSLWCAEIFSGIK